MADKNRGATLNGNSLLRRVPLLAALKGLANGVNPRWWPYTVIVSKSTGNIIRLEDTRGNLVKLEDKHKMRTGG
ncbi:MAG: hypothetical protein BZY88_09685 [SAR202 cluster bacterium Io17-Chloro-G9]|nr:MAG: hypothetical protein BZY88_09685 [SAR202 cluster bacterium Io17-Chloro-G9]